MTDRWPRFTRLRLTVPLLAALAVAGCQSADNELTVVVIPKGLTHEFWQSIHRGAERAAADLNAAGRARPVRIIWDGPLRERDSLEQIRIVDRRISYGVNGIVLAPQHSQTMTAPVHRAVDAGIPVVIIDSGLNRPDLFIKYVATDNYNGGKLAAEHLLRVLEQAGNKAPRLVLFRYAVGSESTEQREKGFEDEVNRRIKEQKDRGEPAITWVSTDKYAGATRDSAQREASPLISQFRDQIDGIFAVNESAAGGMLTVLRSLGLAGKVHLMGFDSSPDLLQAVRTGEIDGLIVQDPYLMGYLATWTLVKHLEGSRVNGGDLSLAPKFHLTTFEEEPVVNDGKKGKYLSTGEYIIVRDKRPYWPTSNMWDVDEPGAKKLFDPEHQRQRVISPKLWPVREDAAGKGRP
jgi:ribose transport system substrate-binding protein